VGLHAVAGVHPPLERAQLGLVGDVADRPGLGAAAEQGPLWALQDLDPLQVGQEEVHVAGRELHRLFVEIEGDVREVANRRAGLVAGEARREAADEDVALAGAVVSELHVGREAEQLLDGEDVLLVQRLGREGLERHGHVLHRLLAVLGRDDHLLEGGGRWRRRCCIGRARRARAARHQGRERARQEIVRLHDYPPLASPRGSHEAPGERLPVRSYERGENWRRRAGAANTS
jgi:hypothetical protein